MAHKRYFIKYTYSVHNIDTGNAVVISKNANIQADLYTDDVRYIVEKNCIPYNETPFNLIIDFMIEVTP